MKSWLRCNFIFSLATYTYSVGVGGRRDQLFYYCWIQVAAAEATAEAELRQSLKELREKMDDEREQALEEARLVNKFSQNLNLVQTLLFHPKAKEHTSHERPPALERAQPYLTLSIVYCCKKYCFASHNFFPTQCKRLPITFIISVTRSSVIIIRHFISTEYLRRHTGIM